MPRPQGFFHRLRHVFTPVWFIKMDTNQDGYIAPEEFDEHLTETIMKKFNSLYYEVL